MQAERTSDGWARGTTLSQGEILADAMGARFRIVGLIGKGGMGEVYRGEAEDGRAVAVKTLPLALADDPKLVKRTQFESETLRALRHPNVVPVIASGVREDGVIFMVMEYLVGMTLTELRRASGKIPIPWALEIMRDVCRGLGAIHEHAVHRDLKPANLHFDVEAVVRVLDLGAARWKRTGLHLTSTGKQLGTIAYMAPEQVSSTLAVEVPADIWSVGMVLFELLANRHPFAFEGQLPDNAFEVGCRIIQKDHLPLRDVAPLCPGSLARLLDRALDKDPRRRFPTAGALEAAITEEMEAFTREHGISPPLSALAEQLFPGQARPSRPRHSGVVVVKAPSKLLSTAPVDEKARRPQPSALPYLRTAAMPASTDPQRWATPPPQPEPHSLPAASLAALPAPSLTIPPAPGDEPHRSSGVVAKEAPAAPAKGGRGLKVALGVTAGVLVAGAVAGAAVTLWGGGGEPAPGVSAPRPPAASVPPAARRPPAAKK